MKTSEFAWLLCPSVLLSPGIGPASGLSSATREQGSGPGSSAFRKGTRGRDAAVYPLLWPWQATSHRFSPPSPVLCVRAGREEMLLPLLRRGILPQPCLRRGAHGALSLMPKSCCKTLLGAQRCISTNVNTPEILSNSISASLSLPVRSCENAGALKAHTMSVCV